MTDPTDRHDSLDWLNLDELMPVETRDRVRDVTDQGVALAPALAAWAKQARELVDYDLPAGLCENREVVLLLGLDELDDTFTLLSLLAMHPHGDIGPKGYEIALAAFPEYSELIESSAMGRSLALEADE